MKTKIDCEKALIKEIFTNWYSIPNYQRPYVWETEQVEELLECIKNMSPQTCYLCDEWDFII